jgi:hypothetical protein
MRFMVVCYHGDNRYVVGRGFRTIAAAEACQRRFYARGTYGADYLIEGRNR